jgi:hypothetical protein
MLQQAQAQAQQLFQQNILLQQNLAASQEEVARLKCVHRLPQSSQSL